MCRCFQRVEALSDGTSMKLGEIHNIFVCVLIVCFSTRVYGTAPTASSLLD